MAVMSNQLFLINGEMHQHISPLDRGFSYGDGVFRTMRVHHGLPSNWHLHYQKLVADCASIGIVCPSADLLMNDIHRLFLDDVVEQQTSVAKIIITRGEGERGYAPPAITTPLRVVLKFPLPNYAEKNYTSGVELTLCKTRLGIQPQLAGIKHLNRLENVLARMEWRDDHIFDGLVLDTNDQVIEGTMSNVFARFGNELVTPFLNGCGVAGITRLQILALSKPLNLTIKESNLTLDALLNADEVLICNSLYGVFQVTKLLEKTWVTQPLAALLRKTLKYDEAF
jgi:4-amino-4-deoxychorismate lyase